MRKKRRTLTLADKRQIIEDREKYKQSFEEIAEIYGVDRSTVSKICKAKLTYLNAFEKLSVTPQENDANRDVAHGNVYISSQDMLKFDMDSFEPIEKMLAAWLENAIKNKLALSRKILLEKANELYYLLNQDGCYMPQRSLLNEWIEVFIEKNSVELSNEAQAFDEGCYFLNIFIK